MDQIDWELNLGLFNHLPKPLDDEIQYRSLRLALQHFIDKIWSSFSDKTNSVCVYKGVLNHHTPVGYLVELTEILPDEVPLCAEVTTAEIPLLAEKAYLLSSNLFGRIQLKHDASFHSEGPIGVLIPREKTELNQKMEFFFKNHPGVRLVSEERLTLEWDCLEELHIFHPVNQTVKRKMQGFEAAGGTIFSHTEC